MNRPLPGLIAVILIASTHAHAEPTAQRSLLDDASGWKTVAAEGVQIHAAAERSQAGGSVLRIDFDFTAGAGYGGVALDLPIELPENYAFTLRLRGEGPANNLELKLVDPEGLNVWWVNRRAFEWPAETVGLVNRRRHFQFAWGPSGGREPMKKLGRVELIIAANEGGRGSVWIEDLSFAELPPEQPYAGKPVASASSGSPKDVLSNEGQPWIASADDKMPSLTIDFGQPRELGGIVVTRPRENAVAHYSVESSDDGVSWHPIRRVVGATELPNAIALPDLQTRWLRLVFDASEKQAGVARVEFLEPAVGASPNALWRLRATRAMRGLFPRTLRDEQSFWTIVGQPGDDREALINEEGQIEVDRRSFSLEPFIVRDGRLLTWADGEHVQSLRDGWMPIPSVIRKHDGLDLTITALASREAGRSTLHAAYTLKNTSDASARGRFALAIRPIQVLPPWQDLNITGGFAQIGAIHSDGQSIHVDAKKRIVPNAGFQLAATTYDAGDPVEMLANGRWPASDSARCMQGAASGLIGWDYDLEPGASTTFVVSVPFHGEATADHPRDGSAFEKLCERVAAEWSQRIDGVKFQLPESARQFHDTIRATQAYILINHDGNGFQPGSRTYERSWIRDGSMTSAAMLEFGHDELVRRFIDWYAPFQFPSGKVPCVVDRRGADPVPEHDSNGQLIWLIANAHRYTGDVELVRRHFPRVKAAVAHIETLRAQRLTDEFGPAGAPRQEPGEPPVPALAFRGLVPESISHEGYSAKPMHSFWDQLFVLCGLNDGAYLADVAGEAELARQWRQLAAEFRASIIASIRIAQQAHGIGYLPGCVELGDFDSTSSTILLWPVDEGANFPREWIDATFSRYWQEFTRRRDKATWEAYTPYELRHVGSYVRLGQKDRAWAVLNWLFAHQRPAGWRHWAEVVWRDPATPRMIGDMPHTWCGSDFLNTARSMFLYENQAEQRLVLFAGVPDEWFTDPIGVSFDGMRTEFGSLSASAKPGGPDHLVIRISGSARPPGGFELLSPLQRPIRSARIGGRDAPVSDGNRIRFNTLPTTIELTY